jgi:tetratricopeptide (TPR) repeat protein
MRLFISYARADRPICSRIIDILEEGHQAWYDERIYIGEKWWEAIVKRIAWADGFIFLISPRSIASIHCQKEFRLAELRKKHIFPVLIEPVAHIPEGLSRYQYVDISSDLTVDNITELHHALLKTERHIWKGRMNGEVVDVEPVAEGSWEEEPPEFNTQTYTNDIARAMANEEYDNAIFWLKTAIRRNYTSNIYDFKKMLDLAEELIAEQQLKIQANAEYLNICNLATKEKTVDLALQAYQNFIKLYPDFDDYNNIAEKLHAAYMPPITWCSVPEGKVSLAYKNRRYARNVPAFRISKYPITNAQYQAFIDAEDGYNDARWWNFSDEADKWHFYHPKPPSSRSDDDEHPRVNVSWYDARAFCNWLSYKLDMDITLPSEEEWQRAAQGDDNRLYPWGNQFRPEMCNGRTSRIGRLTPVKRFEKGKSPFNVVDMAGNMWEWTLSGHADNGDGTLEPAMKQDEVVYRIVKGGSYDSTYERLRCRYRVIFHPNSHFGTIGFRVVTKER